MIVADNGKGLPDNFDAEERETLGIMLIETLSYQLRGEFTFENTDEGTKFSLEFEREDAPLKVPKQ